MDAIRRRIVAIITIVVAIFQPSLTRSVVNISNAWLLPHNDFPVFYRHFRDRVTWFEADAVCQFHHAQLATVESNNQFEAIRGYLKELDVTENVWIGLKRNSEASEFTWTNYQPLARDGYFREEIPRSSDPVCVVTDPTANFKWHSLHCGGPEVASFVCELPVPYWASKSNGCMTSMMEGMTITFLPESPAIQLTKECYPGYSKNVTCKGNMKPSEIMEKLSCTGSNKPLKTHKPLKPVMPEMKSTTTTTTSTSAESDMEDYAIEMATISQYNDETFQSISKVMGHGNGGIGNLPQEMSIALEPIKSSGRGSFDTNGIDSTLMGGIAETTVSAAVASAHPKIVASAGTTIASTSTTTAASAGTTIASTSTTTATTAAAATTTTTTTTTTQPTTKSAVDPATAPVTTAATERTPPTETAVTSTTATVFVPAVTTATAATTTATTAGPGKSTSIRTTTQMPNTSTAGNVPTLTTNRTPPTTTVKTTTTSAGTTTAGAGHHHHHHHRLQSTTAADTTTNKATTANAPTAEEQVRTVSKTLMMMATTTDSHRPPIAVTATSATSVVTPTAAPMTTTSSRRPVTITTASAKIPYTIATTTTTTTTNRRAIVQRQQNTDDVTARVLTAGNDHRVVLRPAGTADEVPKRVYKKIDLPVLPRVDVEPVVVTAAAAVITIAGNAVTAEKPAAKQHTTPVTVPKTDTSPTTTTTAAVSGPPDDNNSSATADDTDSNTASFTPSSSATANAAGAYTAATGTATTGTAATTTNTTATANNPHRKMNNYDAYTEHPNRSRHIGRPKQQHHHTYPYILYRLLG